MRSYREEVRECVGEWLKKLWEIGYEGEISNAYNHSDDLNRFSQWIMNSNKNIDDILDYDIKNREEALDSIIHNGREIATVFDESEVSCRYYFLNMTYGNYILLDRNIRYNFIPKVLYEAISDTIEYYNDLEDDK